MSINPDWVSRESNDHTKFIRRPFVAIQILILSGANTITKLNWIFFFTMKTIMMYIREHQLFLLYSSTMTNSDKRTAKHSPAASTASQYMHWVAVTNYLLLHITYMLYVYHFKGQLRVASHFIFYPSIALMLFSRDSPCNKVYDHYLLLTRDDNTMPYDICTTFMCCFVSLTLLAGLMPGKKRSLNFLFTVNM